MNEAVRFTPAGLIVWTPELCKRISDLADKRLSARQIAKELGFATKNSVSHKARALGIKLRGSHLTPSEKKPPFKLTVRDDEPASNQMNIIDLTEATCHWPTHRNEDDTQWLFCGLRTENGPYCSYHHCVSVEPGSTRRAISCEGL